MIYEMLYGSIVLVVISIILYPEITRAWCNRKQKKRWSLD